jgi:methylated-DNA-[protein]-cysteine S-methyltransferase
MSNTSSSIEARLETGPEVDLDAGALVAEVARRAGDDVDLAYAVHDSPIGPLVVAASPAGLAAISFGGEEAGLAWLAEKVSPRLLRLPERVEQPRRQLDEYFAGQRRRFDLTLDWGLVWGFRRMVLQHLALLPFGETVTYGELAREVGRPKAARAVGTAMATNPIPIVVPCHRVLAAGGKLGGYAGGVDTKRRLLDLESGAEEPRLF